MRKLLTALATTTILMVSNTINWKAEAAIGHLAVPNGYSPVEKVLCVCNSYGCSCGRRHYRLYGSPGYPGYRPQGYRGYSYRSYGSGDRSRYWPGTEGRTVLRSPVFQTPPTNSPHRSNVGFGQTQPLAISSHPFIALNAAVKPLTPSIDFDSSVSTDGGVILR